MSSHRRVWARTVPEPKEETQDGCHDLGFKICVVVYAADYTHSCSSVGDLSCSRGHEFREFFPNRMRALA